MKITTGLIAIAVAAFIILALAIAALLFLGKDAATYVGLVGSLLASIVTAVVLLSGMHQQNNTLAAQGSDLSTVKSNTNGTLSALRAENAAQAAQLMVALAKLNPEDASSVLESTLTKSQVANAVAIATAPPVDVPATVAATVAPAAPAAPVEPVTPPAPVANYPATIDSPSVSTPAPTPVDYSGTIPH